MKLSKADLILQTAKAKPLVSFIIPVHNTGKYLEKCTDSILEQTCKEFEIIIVDDGSTDNSINIAEKIQNDNASRITLIKSEHVGHGHARNIGTGHASGKYIFFADSDDYFIDEDMLKTIKPYLDGNDIVKIQAKRVWEDGKEDLERFNINTQFECNGVEAIKKMIESKTFFGATWLYFINSDFYKKNGFEFHKDKMYEDFGLIPLVILKSEKFVSVPHVCYAYLQRGNSLTKTNTEVMKEKKERDLLFFSDKLQEEIKKSKLAGPDLKLFEDFLKEYTQEQLRRLNTSLRQLDTDKCNLG